MITKIKIENYKAFDKAEVSLKPITVLIGANSVGKSSIIQLLLLLQQTAKENLKSYKSALKLHGGYVNLGNPQNLFRKLDVLIPIQLNFTVDSPKLKLYFTKLFAEFIRDISFIPRYIPIKSFLDLKTKKINSKNTYEEFIDAFISVMQKETKIEEYIEQVKWFLDNRVNINLNDLTSTNKKTLTRLYELLENISKEIKNNYFDFQFKIIHTKNKLSILEFQISSEDNIIVKFINNDGDSHLYSNFVNFSESENKEILNYFQKDNTLFTCFSKENRSNHTTSTITNYLLNIIFNSLNTLKEEFSEQKINYVSPLRAHPKRYYMLDKAKMNLTLDTLDGDAIADVLKDDSKLSKEVNNWLEKFKLSVNVEEFKEVVHHLRVKQNELNLDITDVGFGISQVLPVIIQGFLSPKDSTTIIEQPEIHLHPTMQADLADLFINIVKTSKNKKLVIETHSEYLLKRLRRRISEKVISPNDVSICLFYPQTLSEGGTIKDLKIEEKGYFEWPEDFYGGELYNDTVEFLKNQN